MKIKLSRSFGRNHRRLSYLGHKYSLFKNKKYNRIIPKYISYGDSNYAHPYSYEKKVYFYTKFDNDHYIH